MHHVSKGQVPRQAHVGLPEGTVEEELGRGGFFGRAAHLYRPHPPVGWTRIEGPLRPHAFDLRELGAPSGDYLLDRAPVLGNDDVTVSVSRVDAPMPYAFRNADADELLFVHRGAGDVECDFGRMPYRRGDYLLVPRGVAHRFVPREGTFFFVIESRDEIGLPERGLLGHHALFDLDVVGTPEPGPSTLPERSGERELRIKHRGEVTRVFYPFDPLHSVGYKGDLAVWRLNVADIRPILSERYHLPPSAHATFVTPSWVVCTFLPRPLETGDPSALRVPFYHSNIDYDEVLFYHDGDFFSREGIAAGMLTFHPQGIHHGPQPRAVERAAEKTRTDEIAVMLDTRRPLDVLPSARAVENPDYWQSWK